MPTVLHGVPLAPRTTLELGGPAEHFVAATTADELSWALAEARGHGWPVTLLGGGSNVLVPDGGVPGLVVALGLRGRSARVEGDATIVTASAGEPWDELVAWTVAQGLQGLEALSGIPGSVGATPIQNVGAYGQDVADTLARVHVVELATGRARTLDTAALGLGYRTSALKRSPGEFAVTAVEFRLRAGAPPPLGYAELERALAGVAAPTVAQVRDAVLALRRGKSMVLDPADENRRSVGSFFTNPVLDAAAAFALFERAKARGLERMKVPHWPLPDGDFKFAAGWLIEQAGVTKGLRVGPVGVSTKHALALVHHGGGTTAQLLALADDVVGKVDAAFGVRLEREPVLLGAR